MFSMKTDIIVHDHCSSRAIPQVFETFRKILSGTVQYIFPLTKILKVATEKKYLDFSMRACCRSVVVGSHVQRIALATEETTVTQQVSHKPIKCQSRLWSQRGTKVNGSHHGDNPLLRPAGIQIATEKLCDSTSNGTYQCQNCSSNLLTPYREQPRSTRIVVAYPRPAFSATKRTNDAPTSFDQQVQVSQGHTLYRNKEN